MIELDSRLDRTEERIREAEDKWSIIYHRETDRCKTWKRIGKALKTGRESLKYVY